MNAIRLLLGAAALATATHSIAAEARVEVRFSDPEKFSDLRTSSLSTERERAALTDELRRHLEREAPQRLPAGMRLAITITDVDMAGEFRPVGRAPMPDLRVVKEHDAPRVDLDFRLLRADGTVEREGHRELRDTQFLARTGPGRADLLRFEKALLDRWLEREFATPR